MGDLINNVHSSNLWEIVLLTPVTKVLLFYMSHISVPLLFGIRMVQYMNIEI